MRLINVIEVGSECLLWAYIKGVHIIDKEVRDGFLEEVIVDWKASKYLYEEDQKGGSHFGWRKQPLIRQEQS